MSLLTDVLQGPTSPTWNINSPLIKEKLLLQNQVPQSKNSYYRALMNFPSVFAFQMFILQTDLTLTVQVLYFIQ